jgi:uncharacterized protein (TIGR00251 family)
MVLVRQEGDSASFRVHVQPKSSHEAIVGEADGILKLRVTAPPVEGRANEACLRLLAEVLDLPISCLRIVSGQHARVKTIRVAAPPARTIRAKLCDLTEGPRR